MARVGFSKNTAVQSLEARQTTHKHVGSKVFEVEDVTQKLIHTIGGGFFNEPRYYSEGESKRDAKGRALDNPRDEQGMTEQAQEVIKTAKAVASGPHPEDLLIIANWVRTDLHLRTTPGVLLAIAADTPACRPFLRRYTKAVIQRADELRQVFAAYNHLFNLKEDGKRKHGLPHSLVKGLRDAFLKFKESALLKYDSDDRPTLGDVALMIREEKRLPKPIFEWLVNRKVINAEETPVIAARQKLNGLKKFDAEAKELAKKSYANWEVLVSQFGGTKEVWQYLVDADLLGYMAMMRNLRNMEGAGISDAHWDKVVAKLSTEQGHKQLPFRFLAARRQVSGQASMSAVDAALDKAVENVPEIPGKTFIMVDSSASMDQQVSTKSKMSLKDAGYAMSAILAKKVGHKAIIACFGTHLKIVPFSASDSTMSIIEKMVSAGHEVNCSTHAFLALKYLLAQGVRSHSSYEAAILSPVPSEPVKVDRIVVISDMACYGNMGDGQNLGKMLLEYRQKVNPDVKYYSINMAGESQSQLDPKDKNSLLISGWSESIFSMIREFEGLLSESKDQEVPSIELIRERFRVAA